jgi:hypothetical protein
MHFSHGVGERMSGYVLGFQEIDQKQVAVVPWPGQPG